MAKCSIVLEEGEESFVHNLSRNSINIQKVLTGVGQKEWIVIVLNGLWGDKRMSNNVGCIKRKETNIYLIQGHAERTKLVSQCEIRPNCSPGAIYSYSLSKSLDNVNNI